MRAGRILAAAPPYALVAITGAALLLLGACAGSDRLSPADYERQLSVAGQQLGDSLEGIFSDPAVKDARSMGEAASAVRRGAATMRTTIGLLEDLNPPEDATAAHDRLVRGVRLFAADLDAFANAAADGDLAAVKTFDEQVSSNSLPSIRQIREAIDELRALGYDVGDR
jgi:hypothetical protein